MAGLFLYILFSRVLYIIHEYSYATHVVCSSIAWLTIGCVSDRKSPLALQAWQGKTALHLSCQLNYHISDFFETSCILRALDTSYIIGRAIGRSSRNTLVTFLDFFPLMQWGKREKHMGVWWENMKERNILEDLGVDENAIWKGVLKKFVENACTGLIWLRLGTNGGICEGGDEPFGVMK